MPRALPWPRRRCFRQRRRSPRVSRRCRHRFRARVPALEGWYYGVTVTIGISGRTTVRNIAALAAALMVAATLTPAAGRIHVMLLDGDNNHRTWPETSKLMKK